MQNQIAEPFSACLDILRRLPPQETESNMDRLIALRPEFETDLRNAVDVPSKVLLCPKTKQEFLACDYNRVGDGYRSPWSHEIVGLDGQVRESGEALPERLVEMEKLANKAFGSYRQLYYEGGISSSYFWPCNDEDDEQKFAFGAAILLQKCVDQEGDLSGARWDSIHVIEVEQQNGQATFCMTSTVLLDLNGDFQGIDEFKLNGSLTRQQESTAKVSNDSDFVSAIGRLVEDMEGRMRSNLQEIYFGKTHEIVNELRPAALPEGFLRNQGDFRDEMRMRCGAK